MTTQLPLDGHLSAHQGLHRPRGVLDEVAESTRWGIPAIVAANSKNETGGFRMGATPEDQPFTQWPGTLGLAATGSLEVIESFAAHSRPERVASGLRKGYMYMADVITDPRWFRGHGTFGEDPVFVARAMDALVRGFQGEAGLEISRGCGLGG